MIIAFSFSLSDNAPPRPFLPRQQLILDRRPRLRTDAPRRRQTLFAPSGQLLKFELHASWGDPYYIGLDAIDMFRSDGSAIRVPPTHVHAIPHSLAEVGNASDPRTPPKLFAGAAPGAGRIGWLTPLTTSLRHGSADPAVRARWARDNMLYVLLETPTALGAIVFRNYSKTPVRGAREVTVWLDSQIVYRGGLPMVGSILPPRGRGMGAAGVAGGGAAGEAQHSTASGEHAILFSNDAALVRRFRPVANYCGSSEQDVLCINEGQVQIRAKHMNAAPDPCAHGVWAAQHSEQARPTTSAVNK
jgi:hypothetical protein